MLKKFAKNILLAAGTFTVVNFAFLLIQSAREKTTDDRSAEADARPSDA